MQNKYALILLALFCSGSAVAQQGFQPHNLAKVPHLQSAPYQKGAAAIELFTPALENPHPIISGASNRDIEEIVGVTRWDAQSYACIASRVYYQPNGEPTATWTFATDGNNAFPERGTGYSTRSGGAWSPSTSRIESERTGFPSASILANGTEVAVTHATGFTPFRLMFLSRAQGATTWTESYLPTPAGQGCLWPHLVVGGPDGNTIHIIAITTPVANAGTTYEGINGHLLYWRSNDGGTTWDKSFEIIPGLDNTQYTVLGADEYGIDANGSSVAIAAFPAWNDLIAFKSYDNGDTWESSIAIDFPDALENYAGLAGETYTVDDVGTPDPDAPDSLAVFSSDGSGNVLMDDNGEVHLFFGRMYYSDADPAAGSSFYPGINGLIHWKESFGTGNFQIITGALDYDGDNQLGITTIDDIAPYYMSLSGMPSSGTDAAGTIYVGYTAIHELYRSTNATEQFFRHVYMLKSEDNGETWGEPIDMITAPYIADTVLIPFVECVYPMLPRHFGDRIGLVYQQDYEAGVALIGPTAAGNHPHVENSLLWIELDKSEIPTTNTFSPITPSLEVRISPNPASEQAFLTANVEANTDVLVEIFDLMGQRVFQNKLSPQEGTNTLTLPAKNLPNGTYWVRVTQGRQFGITKWVIAK